MPVPSRRALVVAGGARPARHRLATVLGDDVLVVAADGGLDTAVALDIAVDVVIGDLDSVSPGALARARAEGVEVITHPPDKDETDLELALALCAARGITELVVLAAGGGRIDHELANVTLIASPRWASLAITLLDERGRIVVVHGERRLPVGPGAVVTLLAVGGPATGVTTAGLAWPLDDEVLDAGSTRGVSNVATAATPRVAVETGTLLAVLPWAHDDDAPTLPRA